MSSPTPREAGVLEIRAQGRPVQRKWALPSRPRASQGGGAGTAQLLVSAACDLGQWFKGACHIQPAPSPSLACDSDDGKRPLAEGTVAASVCEAVPQGRLAVSGNPLGWWVGLCRVVNTGMPRAAPLSAESSRPRCGAGAELGAGAGGPECPLTGMCGCRGNAVRVRCFRQHRLQLLDGVARSEACFRLVCLAGLV